MQTTCAGRKAKVFQAVWPVAGAFYLWPQRDYCSADLQRRVEVVADCDRNGRARVHVQREKLGMHARGRVCSGVRGGIAAATRLFRVLQVPKRR